MIASMQLAGLMVPAGAWAGMVLWTVAALAAGAAVFERLRDSVAEEA